MSDTTTDDGARSPWVKRAVYGLLVIPGVLAVIVGILAFYLAFSRVPLPDDLQVGITTVLDANGDEIGTLANEESRRDVDVTELPEHVGQAVLAAEDRGFYEHRGVSVTGIARALVSNVRTGDLTGQGGSTITQQYVKNALLTPEQTFRRKLNEAALSIKLEQAYEKDEILSFYLSTIYWGRGAYGVDAAARTYYGVPAAELDVNQAATLAGIIRSPEALDPVEAADAVETRRVYVLDGMLEEGFIDQATHDELVAAGIPETGSNESVGGNPDAAYYLDAVRREVTPLVGDSQLFSGLTIRTAMVPSAQSAAQQVVTDAVAENAYDSGGLVAVDPATGGVVALVGGPDFASQQLNVAVQGSNQVGSSFKPFTLTQFVSEGLHPDSRFDAPATIEVEGTEFRNYGGTEYGRQTVREATVSSTNTVYVQMQQEVGSADVIDTAVALGLPAERETSEGTRPTMEPFSGLTLGQDQFTVTEVAGAYATLAAEGVRRDPFTVVEILDREGEVIYERSTEEQEAVDANVAAVVSDVLVDVVSGGTGSAAAVEGRPVAGKTGTTNDNRDAWFAGYTPQLAAAVWVGNLDDSPVEGLTGGSSAAPLFLELLDFCSTD